MPGSVLGSAGESLQSLNFNYLSFGQQLNFWEAYQESKSSHSFSGPKLGSTTSQLTEPLSSFPKAVVLNWLEQDFVCSAPVLVPEIINQNLGHMDFSCHNPVSQPKVLTKGPLFILQLL